jgi:hypothetical protein
LSIVSNSEQNTTFRKLYLFPSSDKEVGTNILSCVRSQPSSPERLTVKKLQKPRNPKMVFMVTSRKEFSSLTFMCHVVEIELFLFYEKEKGKNTPQMFCRILGRVCDIASGDL